LDPKLAPLVTEAFKEMATGQWTLKEWAAHVHSMGHRSRHGFRIGVGAWSDIFHNRFYLGETWLKRGDIPTKGNHEPLVDSDIFAMVQEILKRHDNYKQRTQRHKYLLQGLLFSEDTETQCYVETHPRKKISYYRTKGKVNGGQVFYNTRDIDKQVPLIIKAHTVTADEKVKIEKLLEEWFASENKDNSEFEKANNRLDKLDRMEKNLQELVLEEEISKDDFKQHRMRIEAEKANLKDLVETIRSRMRFVRGDFETALEIARNLDLLYKFGDDENRRLLCETVFRRISVRDGKIVKVERNHPFELIYSQTKSSESLPTGTPGGIRTPDKRFRNLADSADLLSISHFLSPW
jgi:hypothetical protein